MNALVIVVFSKWTACRHGEIDYKQSLCFLVKNMCYGLLLAALTSDVARPHWQIQAWEDRVAIPHCQK